MTSGPEAILTTATPNALRQLAAVCRESSPLGSIPAHILRQIVGGECYAAAIELLDNLTQQGMSLEHIAVLLEHVAGTREIAAARESLFELVLSGPQVEGVATRDTFAVVNELFVNARHEVLLVGYAVHRGVQVFKRLAERLHQEPALKVWMCLDIPRRPNDSSSPDQIVNRFAANFFSEQWPWRPSPDLYYDVRSVAPQSQERSSLHAKCIVVDREIALVTSANFTTAAQHRNVEAGVLIRHQPYVAKLAAYFEGLRDTGTLARVVRRST